MAFAGPGTPFGFAFGISQVPGVYDWNSVVAQVPVWWLAANRWGNPPRADFRRIQFENWTINVMDNGRVARVLTVRAGSMDAIERWAAENYPDYQLSWDGGAFFLTLLSQIPATTPPPIIPNPTVGPQAPLSSPSIPQPSPSLRGASSPLMPLGGQLRTAGQPLQLPDMTVTPEPYFQIPAVGPGPFVDIPRSPQLLPMRPITPPAPVLPPPPGYTPQARQRVPGETTTETVQQTVTLPEVAAPSSGYHIGYARTYYRNAAYYAGRGAWGTAQYQIQQARSHYDRITENEKTANADIYAVLSTNIPLAERIIRDQSFTQSVEQTTQAPDRFEAIPSSEVRGTDVPIPSSAAPGVQSPVPSQRAQLPAVRSWLASAWAWLRANWGSVLARLFLGQLLTWLASWKLTDIWEDILAFLNELGAVEVLNDAAVEQGHPSLFSPSRPAGFRGSGVPAQAGGMSPLFDPVFCSPQPIQVGPSTVPVYGGCSCKETF